MSKLLLIVSFLTCVYARGQELLTLESVLSTVSEVNPSILQYQHREGSILARAEGATSWMPPTFSAGMMRFPYNLEMLNQKDDPMNQAGIAFSVEQMIVNTSRLGANKNYLASLAGIERAKGQWTKNELRREAKVLYYTRFVSERKLDILKAGEEILNVVLATAQEKFSNNQSQLQTIYKAKARLAELGNMRLMLQGSIAEINAGLNALMLRDVGSAFLIESDFRPKGYPAMVYDTAGISGRSDIVAVSGTIESMRLEQEWAQTGLRPDFGIRAEHMQMFGMPNQWSLMGMISIPIAPWSSKMVSAETRSIDANIRSMQEEKLAMEWEARRMLTGILYMMKSETNQYDNYRETIIPAFENNLQANLLAYGQNTGDLFVLLDAWEMLLMKKLEMNDKLLNILKLEADYEYEKEI